jgi:predicted amidophosphoribosyltransferase
VKIFRTLNELLFPERCISCGALGLSICSECRRKWNLHRYNTFVGKTRDDHIQVTSSVIYSSIAQKILLSAKESHIKRADQLVSEAIRHSTTNILKTDWIDVLVPIPSRPRAVRERGRQFIYEITEPISMEFNIPISPILRHSRAVRDQSGLHHNERWNNLKGAFVVDAKQIPGQKALLVDDLVTTGATLYEAARALRYAGIEVIGAVTAAVALAPKIE